MYYSHQYFLVFWYFLINTILSLYCHHWTSYHTTWVTISVPLLTLVPALPVDYFISSFSWFWFIFAGFVKFCYFFIILFFCVKYNKFFCRFLLLFKCCHWLRCFNRKYLYTTRHNECGRLKKSKLSWIMRHYFVCPVLLYLVLRWCTCQSIWLQWEKFKLKIQYLGFGECFNCVYLK